MMSSKRVKSGRQQLAQREVQLFKNVLQISKLKNKETFMKALEIYEKQNSVHKRGHVDFILGSLDKMEEFEAHKDIQAYKALMKIFPEGELVPRNLIQYEFQHYPHQQDTAMQILISMSNVGLIPDDQMGDIIISRFGKYSYVMKRYQRMMYWMPKFRSMNPYPLPWVMPDKMEDLAILALKRMAVDYQTMFTLTNTSEIEGSEQATFIASAISPEQQELVHAHDPSIPLFVEGGFRVWLKDQQLTYFILKADPVNPDSCEKEMAKDCDQGLFTFIGAKDSDHSSREYQMKKYSVHEQIDATILAMCITGTSSKESLASWIAMLQKDNAALQRTPIIFSLKTPDSSLTEPSNNFNNESLSSGSG